jgi:tripartite ATP-independent transporter DctP family solute receptor
MSEVRVGWRQVGLVFSLFAVAIVALMVGPARAQSAQWVLKVASVAPDGTPWTEGLNRFKASVWTASEKRLEVRVFSAGTLGDENETVIATQRGQIQGVGASTGAIASLVPELNVLELPYLFRDQKEADHVLDKVILQTMEKAFEARGLVLGFWSENGYRSYGTNFGFVKSPDALKGHKMRSQENPVHIGLYKALGASPVPIPTTEVLTSLQTGVVDGYDNTALFAQAAQWASSTKYYTVTNHIYQPAAIVYNKAFFYSLPADVQADLKSPRAALMQEMREEIRTLDTMLLDNFKAMKVQVYALTPAERQTFDAPAKKAREEYIAKASPAEKALYAQITKGITDYRATHK